MGRKRSRKARPATQPKAGGRRKKQLLVGLALVGVIAAAILGLRSYRQGDQKEEGSLYARGPANAPVVLREFSSFT